MLDKKYPKYFSQLIMMDVPGIVELTTLKQVIFIMMYQLFLAFAFLVGGPIGRIMTQKLTTFFKYRPSYLGSISGAQNYPYYYLWKS